MTADKTHPNVSELPQLAFTQVGETTCVCEQKTVSATFLPLDILRLCFTIHAL